MKTVGSVSQLASGLALFALAACASAPYEGKYAWSDGWRETEVVGVQTAAQMVRPQVYTCVRSTSTEQLATTKFAVVKYRRMSRVQRRAVPLQVDDKVAVGQKVFVKVNDCNTLLIHQSPHTLVQAG